jgi:hypothetical protein
MHTPNLHQVTDKFFQNITRQFTAASSLPHTPYIRHPLALRIKLLITISAETWREDGLLAADPARRISRRSVRKWGIGY